MTRQGRDEPRFETKKALRARKAAQETRLNGECEGADISSGSSIREAGIGILDKENVCNREKLKSNLSLYCELWWTLSLAKIRTLKTIGSIVARSGHAVGRARTWEISRWSILRRRPPRRIYTKTITQCKTRWMILSFMLANSLWMARAWLIRYSASLRVLLNKQDAPRSHTSSTLSNRMLELLGSSSQNSSWTTWPEITMNQTFGGNHGLVRSHGWQNSDGDKIDIDKTSEYLDPTNSLSKLTLFQNFMSRP